MPVRISSTLRLPRGRVQEGPLILCAIWVNSHGQELEPVNTAGSRYSKVNKLYTEVVYKGSQHEPCGFEAEFAL